MDHCDRPPAGWSCSLERGHDGPCPAAPVPGPTVEVRLLMSRELAEQLSTGWSEPVQIMVEQEQDGFWSLFARTPTHSLNHPGSDRWTGGDRKDEP